MRLRVIYLAPLLVFVALSAWAFASPVGSSPDDEYHLTSIWCEAAGSSTCLPGSDSTTRVVPAALLNAHCFAYQPEASAGCQSKYTWTDPTPTELTNLGNFQGAYPPAYYWTMSAFVGPEIVKSALMMRLASVAIFVAMTTALFVLLPEPRRKTLVWGWLITTVPLGLFLIPSNNPSGWAVVGVGSAWLALVGYFERTDKARLLLGAIFALAVLMAAGSRGDAALFSVVAIGVVMLLKFARTKEFALLSILPLLAAAFALGIFATSGQVGTGVAGFDHPASAAPSTVQATSTGALLAYNLLKLPYLWTGVFGGWGLGWLDTELPSIVLWASSAVFIALGFLGLSRVSWRKVAAVAGVGALLIAIPVYVLGQSHEPVGAQVQPRYLLPLVVLLGGLLVFETRARTFALGRVQIVTLVAALAVSNLVALHTNIRRYVTGTDVAGLNLDARVEWWWSGPVTPMMVWLAGSLAFVCAIAILIREVAWPLSSVVRGAS